MQTPRMPRSIFRDRPRTGVTESFRLRSGGPIPTASSAGPARKPASLDPVAAVFSAAASIGAGEPMIASARDIGRISARQRKINGCVLCPDPAIHAVTWIPTAEASRRLGAATEKTRAVIVGLCAACKELPDAIERIEQTMFAEAAAGLARPESN